MYRFGIFGVCTLIAICAYGQEQHVKVYEYCPAPGQFVNTLPEADNSDTPATMADKCTESLNNGELITLGAYGGYIIFGLEHPVVNLEGKYDLLIKGNATQGASEPGIVMVSVDTNGNGLPDDEWYELSGSADNDNVSTVIYDYEITYTYAEMQPVPWHDNQGNSGQIDRNVFHQQEYYPVWLDNELKFSGTRLPNNGVDKSGNGSYWVLEPFDYGYVDNMPNSETEDNSFNIEWAVDSNRQPVHLAHIDFVKVYTAMNQQCGWIGETSTEISGAKDLHLQESIDYEAGITTIVDDNNAYPVDIYGIDGSQRSRLQPGINIIRYSNGKTVKMTNK